MSYQDEKKLNQQKLIFKVLGISLAIILILASVFLKQISAMVGNNLVPQVFPIVKYVLLAAGIFDIIFFVFVVK